MHNNLSIGNEVKFTDWSLSEYPVKGVIEDIQDNKVIRYITVVTQRGMRYRVDSRNVIN